MKWIFYSLLCINLGYLALNLSSEDTQSIVVTSSAPGADIKKLRLLSEVSNESSRQEEAVRVLENPVLAEAQATEARCSGLGPFADLTTAQDVSERLAAMGYVAELKAIDRQLDQADYRVVLPPYKSLQEAFRRLRELKARDIDSYVITQGPDAQGISLGLFSSDSGALLHQQALVGMGYDVEIREIPRMTRDYWLLRADGDFEPTIVSEVVAEFNEVSVTESVCLN